MSRTDNLTSMIPARSRTSGPARTAARLSTLILIAGSLGLTPSGTVAAAQPPAVPASVEPAASASTYQPLNPARLLDTRTGVGGVPARRLADGEVLSIQVTDRHGVAPSGVAAVSLNLTVTGALASGFITAYPCDAARPLVSNLNHRTAQTVANAAVVPVPTDGPAAGTVCFYAERSTHLVVDVNGWFPTSTSGFTAVTPQRMFDTRTGWGGIPTGRVGDGGTLSFSVAGKHGLPASGIEAVSLNVTATGASTAGFLSVYPCAGGRPLISNVNYRAGQAVATAVVVPVSNEAVPGSVCFYAETAVHVIADVNAWFAIGGAFTPVTPSRLVDTRTTPAASIALSTTVVPQVTGGTSTTVQLIPWQARVTIGQTVCGGSLIHARWVVTAAHCLSTDSGIAAPPSVRVWTGQSFTSQMTLDTANSVADIVIHPAFNPVTYANDIALLRLAAPTSAGAPVRLFEDPGGPLALTPALVSGWGETVAFSPPPDQLQSARLYVRASPGAPCGDWGANYLPATMLCASGGVSSPTGEGGCRGDSGGPLALSVGGVPHLTGVVSFGAQFCPNDHSAPTVFTRVSAFVSWIRQHAPAPGQVVDDLLRVRVAGAAGVPESGAGAVVLNVTSTGTTSPGFITVTPCGSLPLASNLNTVPGAAIPNLVVAPLSETGEVCLYSPTPTHLVVDVFGWLAA